MNLVVNDLPFTRELDGTQMSSMIGGRRGVVKIKVRGNGTIKVVIRGASTGMSFNSTASALGF